MFEPDSVGRIWLDDDSFLAPFGHFKADYEFVVSYLRQPQVSSRTFYEGFDETAVLSNYCHYLKNGIGWIGFHKRQRAAYLLLELVSTTPLIFAVHGGLSLQLFGKGYGRKSMDFVKHYVFEQQQASKLEGYILKPNNLIRGFFKRGGLTKECEMKDRLLIDGQLSPITIYGITRDKYLKEKEHGRRISTKATVTGRTDGSSKKGKRKTRGRKKRKSR